MAFSMVVFSRSQAKHQRFLLNKSNAILKIGTNLSAMDCDGVIDVYNSIGWGGNYSHKEIRAMYAPGNYYAILYFDEKVAGILRAFGDNSSITWLAELAVHSHLQRNGVGSILMKEFLKSHSHTAIYAEVMAGQEEFFSRFDISRKSSLLACSRAAVLRRS